MAEAERQLRRAGFNCVIVEEKNEDVELGKVIKQEPEARENAKKGTDVTIARGMFSKECKVVYVDGLDTDWRIVGQSVVNWDKYKKAKEDEER